MNTDAVFLFNSYFTTFSGIFTGKKSKSGTGFGAGERAAAAGGGALFGSAAEKLSPDKEFSNRLAQLEKLADVASAGGRADLTKKVLMSCVHNYTYIRIHLENMARIDILVNHRIIRRHMLL